MSYMYEKQRKKTIDIWGCERGGRQQQKKNLNLGFIHSFNRYVGKHFYKRSMSMICNVK